jgi:hypothetical protein
MTDYKKVAVHDVRDVLWKELQGASLMDPNNYYADGFMEPLVPIIPAQQVPEFNNLLPGKTYLIYDILQTSTGVAWWMSQETITLTVASISTTEIQTIINFITDVFRRYDTSAKEVNLQISTASPFKFHFFRLESSDPVQAFHNEGGFMSGIISVTYSYSRDLDPDTGRYL